MSTNVDLSVKDRTDRSNLVDWLGLGDMVTIVTEQLLAPVEGTHRAMGRRWFRMAGRSAEPEAQAIDGLTASAYRAMRLGGSAVGSTVSVVSELASDHVRLPPVWETAKGRYVQSIFNAVWGDKLEEVESPLRIKLCMRDIDGSPVSINPASLRGAFPNHTRRLVVLLHGLGETEHSWRSDGLTAMAAGLEADGFTVLELRYNTGRPIVDNGMDLADFLEAVQRSWPVPVEEVALVGHSMGALVAQRAVMHAHASGHLWADLATHLVAIGAPHLGSGIEKGVHALSMGLGYLEETRPVASFLESRSAGIKDLRYGANHRPDAVQYHIVAGVITTEPDHPLGVLFGDLVVTMRSAIGRGRHSEPRSSNELVLGGRGHGDLPLDPEVVSHTRRWLTAGQ